ncbi:hypothetical protein [Siminovitchia terrae]|uniref:hypothetical protein n=1 Tax=Siminovitchia terrae TaxID=1914933 RepID=UPI0028AE182F|nr:hypothetical protein [Siminovitchia terrae]
MRKIILLDWLYLGLQLLILLFLFTHDWISFGSLNDVEAVKQVKTTRELIIQTILNGAPFAPAFFFCSVYVGKAYPLLVKIFLNIYFPVLLIGAIWAWWIPYFFGTTPEKVQQYQWMFGKTHAFLPEMNGITPNTLHLVFHLALLFVTVITIYFSLKRRKNKKIVYK